MKSEDKFCTARGWLTPYALACGYIEVNQDWNNKRFASMGMNNGELNTYEVVAYNEEERINFREVVEGLPAARKLFLACLIERGAKRKAAAPRDC